MVANPLVNQGAAVIVTSLEQARAAGIPEDKLIFVHGGAAASEPRDYLAREQYLRSDAQDVVLEAVQRLCETSRTTLDAYELYSCFPVVPKMAARKLALDPAIATTVTGGLTFFGAPVNNYMTHAACAMTRHLRSGAASAGLLYGQGEYVTKHHALVLGRHPGSRRPQPPIASSRLRTHAAVQSRRSSTPMKVQPVSKRTPSSTLVTANPRSARSSLERQAARA